jgi:hypothetical protein
MTRQTLDQPLHNAPPSGDFDEQLWPIQLIVLTVAGGAAGLVAATSEFPDPAMLDFTDPAVVQTGWGRLAAVVLAYLAATMSILLLQRWVARRVLFCLLVGMIIHLGLGLLLRDQYLEAIAQQIDEARRALEEADDLVVVPDYHVSQIVPSEEPLSFAQPVEVEPPRESQPTAIEKALVKHEVVAERPPPVPLLPEQPPAPSQPEKAELAVPHRGESPNGLEISRQSKPDRLEPNETLPQPEPLATPEVPAVNLAASAAAAQRRTEQSLSPDRASQAMGSQSAAVLPTPAIVPQKRREVAVSLARETAGAASPPVARSRPVDTLDAAAIPPVIQPPGTTAELVAAIDVEQASSSLRRAPGSLVASLSRARSAPQSPAAIPLPPVGAGGLGRPRANLGERPNAENDGAGNPLSRSPRAPRLAGDETAAPAQVASTGTAVGNQPDTAIEASATGPTRRLSGATTDLTIGRSSLSPPAGSLWESGVATAVPSRAASLDRAEPSDSGGGGRDPLARAPLAGSLRAEAAAVPADAADMGGAPAAGQEGSPSGAVAAQDIGATGQETRPTGATGQETRPTGATGRETDPAGATGREARPTGIERRQAGPAVLAGPVAGPGGLSEPPSPLLGIPSRRARPESMVVHTSPGRFMLDRTAPAIGSAGLKPPALPFQQRFPGKRGEVAKAHGATDSSDRAVEQGLHFLSRCQFPDGRWALDRLPPGVVPPTTNAGLGQMNSDTAATGLALLAFLGKGYTHIDDKYRNQVGAGLRWLIANQQADGRLFSDETDQTVYAQFYGNGIATIALSEAFGMTWDEDLHEPLKRAIGFILAAQHPERGGWRYLAGVESDTSVSGWKLMALKSAQMAGLEVPQASLEKVSGWLDLAQGQTGAEYRYNPYALDTDAQRQGRVPNLAMTAEGLLMRLYLGRHRTHPEMIAGADVLQRSLPPRPEETRAARDVYYLYYATQVMFQMQGDYWKVWNDRLRPLLEATQVQTGPLIGSWDPQAPVADRWGHAGGRHYVTAMSLLMLEVYYRHLPLFRELDKQPAPGAEQPPPDALRTDAER